MMYSEMANFPINPLESARGINHKIATTYLKDAPKIILILKSYQFFSLDAEKNDY